MERQKEKFKELQDHFNIDEAELGSTLDDFIREEESFGESKRRLNFPLLSGLVLLGVALTGGIGYVAGSSGWVNQDLLLLLLMIGGVLVITLGLGTAGVRNRAKKSKKSTASKTRPVFSEDEKSSSSQQFDEYGLKKKKKLFRSSSDSMLFGVCGGIAEYFKIDPTIVRIAFAIAAIYYGSSVLLYLILAIALPKRDES